MKVLIAAGIYPPDAGGPATHAKAQFEGLPKFGIKTSLVALAHYRGWPRGIRHLWFLFALICKAFSADVIYAHDTVGVGFPAWLAAKLCGKRFVIRIGGDLAWERHAEESGLSMKEWYERGAYQKDKMFKLSRFTLKQADLVIVIGQSLADLYISRYKISSQKIKVIINPIPKISGAPALNAENTAVFASRLTSYKNLPTALKALAKLSAEGHDLKLVIMGDGPERGKLDKLCLDLKIKDKVIFTGSVSNEEVIKRTASCLFTIAPALTEFNPNYVLQGIGLGKPFIISRENDLPFNVPVELTFNPRNESELYERIASLLQEDQYAKARSFISSLKLNMSWEDNLKQNAEALKDVLNGSK